MFEHVPAAVTSWSCCVLAGQSWTSCQCNSLGQAEIGLTDDGEDLDLMTPANTTRSRTRRRLKKYTRKDHARMISSENGKHKGSAPNRPISSGIMWHPDAPCSHLQTWPGLQARSGDDDSQAFGRLRDVVNMFMLAPSWPGMIRWGNQSFESLQPEMKLRHESSGSFRDKMCDTCGTLVMSCYNYQFDWKFGRNSAYKTN